MKEYTSNAVHLMVMGDMNNLVVLKFESEFEHCAMGWKSRQPI